MNTNLDAKIKETRMLLTALLKEKRIAEIKQKEEERRAREAKQMLKLIERNSKKYNVSAKVLRKMGAAV